MALYAVGFQNSERKISELGAAIITSARSKNEFCVERICGHPLIRNLTVGFLKKAEIEDILFFTEDLELISTALNISLKARTEIDKKQSEIRNIEMEIAGIGLSFMGELKPLLEKNENPTKGLEWNEISDLCKER